MQMAFQLTSSPEDFPAKTSALQGKEPDLLGSDQACGSSSTASSRKSARASRSSKTSQPFALADWKTFSGASLRSGMMRSGIVSPLPPLALLTAGTASGSSLPWQTPVADDAVDRKAGKWKARGEPKPSAPVKLWPTASARDYKDTPGMARVGKGGRDRTDQLARRVYAVENTPAGGGLLNPPWVEWLMGFPEGWTDLHS